MAKEKKDVEAKVVKAVKKEKVVIKELTFSQTLQKNIEAKSKK